MMDTCEAFCADSLRKLDEYLLTHGNMEVELFLQEDMHGWMTGKRNGRGRV